MADRSLEYEPFKVDMAMAIIYEQGSADLMINMQKYHLEAPAVLIALNDQILHIFIEFGQVSVGFPVS